MHVMLMHTKGIYHRVTISASTCEDFWRVFRRKFPGWLICVRMMRWKNRRDLLHVAGVAGRAAGKN